MRKLIQSAVVLGSLSVMALAPVAAEAQSRRDRDRPTAEQVRRDRAAACREQTRGQRNTGTVVGAVAGGVIGNRVAGRRNRTLGTVIGAGAGAVAGHEIAEANQRCR